MWKEERMGWSKLICMVVTVDTVHLNTLGNLYTQYGFFFRMYLMCLVISHDDFEMNSNKAVGPFLDL